MAKKGPAWPSLIIAVLVVAVAVVVVVLVTSSGGDTKSGGQTANNGNAQGNQSGGRTRPLRLHAPNSIYFGATIDVGGQQAPFEMGVADQFERQVHKPLSIISWGQPWYSAQYCKGYCAFTPAQFDAVRAHGSIPLLSWSSFPGNGAFSDAAIASGSQDSYITQWAEAAKAWGHPLFLRLAWEMNGTWYPWAVNSGHANATSFVAMWRHVHDVFERVGATNVTWVWCPNVDAPTTYKPISNLYPGNAYVDWTCLDGYNGDNPWLSFGNLYRESYDEVTQQIAPDKPLMLGEVSSTEQGGSKADWITNMFTVLPTLFPKVRGIVWYEANDPGPGGHTDWPVTSSKSATAAFAAGIASDTYGSNTFGDLATSPIPPPGPGR